MCTACVARPELKEILGRYYATRLGRIDSSNVIDYKVNIVNQVLIIINKIDKDS